MGTLPSLLRMVWLVSQPKSPFLSHSWFIPILGVFLAVAITAAMDATGLANFSAFPLLPLMLLFWWIERIPRRNMGFVWGTFHGYGIAVLYPIAVMGILFLICAASGDLDWSKTDWKKASLNLLLIAVSTTLVGILTEEGFFRGWLWASLEKRLPGKETVLLWTSVFFALWHISPVVLKTGFDLPPQQIPLFIINVAVIGGIWGCLRQMSQSIIVSSVSHGLWNGMAYVLFGYGTKVGALGIKSTELFGPEVGLIGLVLNVAFLLLLLRSGLYRSTVNLRPSTG
jgi:uncharacterized protein